MTASGILTAIFRPRDNEVSMMVREHKARDHFTFSSFSYKKIKREVLRERGFFSFRKRPFFNISFSLTCLFFFLVTSLYQRLRYSHYQIKGRLFTSSIVINCYYWGARVCVVEIVLLLYRNQNGRGWWG